MDARIALPCEFQKVKFSKTILAKQLLKFQKFGILKYSLNKLSTESILEVLTKDIHKLDDQRDNVDPKKIAVRGASILLVGEIDETEAFKFISKIIKGLI